MGGRKGEERVGEGREGRRIRKGRREEQGREVGGEGGGTEGKEVGDGNRMEKMRLLFR